MHKSKSRSSGLFLMELIFAILFFAVASVVCVQIFAKAHTMVEDARVLNYAVSECSSVAETLAASDSGPDAVKKISERYKKPDTSDKRVVAFFDKNFTQCKRQTAAYVLTAVISSDSDMLTADISLSASEGKEIYSITAKHHVEEVRR